jgi:hypothetical protein
MTRLLEDQGHGKLSLVEYDDNNIPCYAVFSHSWGSDGEEVTFKDFMEHTGRDKAGYDILTASLSRAKIPTLIRQCSTGFTMSNSA